MGALELKITYGIKFSSIKPFFMFLDIYIVNSLITEYTDSFQTLN